MYTCDGCKKEFDYEPITPSADPYAPGFCYECLSPEDQKAYDKFFNNHEQQTT